MTAAAVFILVLVGFVAMAFGSAILAGLFLGRVDRDRGVLVERRRHDGE